MKTTHKRSQWAQTATTPESPEYALADTKDKILDTAERLFAERGLEATSIRDITAAAGANLGAINYHFDTKQKLIEAVFNRHIEPVNRRRLALLDQAERNSGGKSPSLEALLEAMIRPTVEGSFAAGKRNTSFMRLMARCHSEPNPEIEQLMRAQFQTMMARFAAAFARALPELPREELFWRLIFTSGAVLHALLISSKEDSLPGGLRKKLDADGLIQRLVAFAAAGMKTSKTFAS
jgi:AcrR family transcriptional regulator